MRILHSADIHLGELSGPVINGQNARLLDTLRCFDFMVEYAERVRPDAILIAGDLFDKSKLWGDNMLYLVNEASLRLRALSKIAPTILMYGTANHDSLKAFENIKAMRIPNLFVEITPKLFQVMTGSGLLQVGVIPGFDKGHFRALNPGMEPSEESMMCSKLLGDIVNGLSAQLDPTIPSVLMAHYTVVGCELDNGQHVFSQSEVVLPKESLAGSAFNLVALGHIHRAQRVEGIDKPVFYSGPVNGITFNEEGQDKGFWVHEIGTVEGDEFSEIPHYVGSEFVKTPYREFLTIKWDDKNVENYLNYSDADPAWFFGTEVANKIIRINYTCSDELNKQLNRKSLEKSLYGAGVFHVSEIKPERITTALVKQELTETSGPLENLYTWLMAEGFQNDEITPILELARPLIATVSAKMPTGTLSGIFEPHSLTVKNYRSYLEESFNFQDIYFATVNGPNGIGKSSFFMDAIRDCLFEETRTGITGSWITSGQADGMITFDFSMGETHWRVIRNRSIKGSGKITLSLQEYIADGDKWENRSGTTTKQTQDKIEALLGMDCATFSCTALVMQDAYGLFMEADKEQRMGVLANILGLSVYEGLADLAKVKVSELNKSLAISKAKLAELDIRLMAKTELESELGAEKIELGQVMEDITDKENEIKAAEELIRTLKAKAEKAEDIRLQIKVIADEVFAKRIEIGTKSQKAERAQKILESEATIMAKSEEYERVRDQVLVLEAKLPRLKELMITQNEAVLDMSIMDTELTKLSLQITDLGKILNSKPELDAVAEQYRAELARLEVLDDLARRASEVNQLILEAEKDTDRTGDEIYDKRLILKDTELKLEELVKKSAMLKNSNCVDPENAKCAFLADAQMAKAQIPVVEAEIKVIEQEITDMHEERKPFLKIVEDLEVLNSAIGYNIHKDYKSHGELRNLVNFLRPKAELAGQLNSKAELLAGLQAQAESTTKRKDELQAKLMDITMAYNALNLELAELPELQERLPKLLQWHTAKDELPAARQIVLSTTDVIKGIEADIAAKEQRIKEIEFDLEFLKVEKDEMSSANVKATRAQGDLEWLKEQQLDITSKIGALNAQLEALNRDEAERQQLAEEMAPTAKSLVRHQTLTRAFGLDGIPFSIVRSVVPELSYQANDILGQMTSGKMALEMSTERVQRNKKEVNALEVWITDWRGRIPYGDRSGGEKVKAALANAFALADLKARRVGIQLGMMFVDEPSFLDSAGAEAYCDALEMLSVRYPNMKVIAISHDPIMKSRFPQVIDVTNDGDQGSRVKLVG